MRRGRLSGVVDIWMCRLCLSVVDISFAKGGLVQLLCSASLDLVGGRRVEIMHVL